MKYAIIKCVNGNYSVYAEGFTDLKSARVSFFDQCKILWNSDDVITGKIMIVDENLDCVEKYKEFITHAAPEPETPEENQEEG